MTNDNIEQIEKATIDFANQIKTKINSEEKTETLLKTDQKVLARITDGIYRHAYSALRELICNSYDADATEIYIDTDVPLFRTITVRDNGNGMSIDTLSNVLHHIGGSAKRNPQKKDLGIFDQKDATLSPIKKRKLIGKIGIGLFSVAQLTRDFTIVTKQRGDDYYLIADIKLNNYSEEMIRQFEKRGEDFDTGIVYVYTQKTSNIEAHGTDIILKNLKQSAIDQLRSIDIWQQSISEDFELLGKPERPSYHIGEIDTDNNELLEDNAVLPWGTDLSPEEKYASLYSQLLKQPNPSYSLNLDNYLQMLWILGLSLPLKYIDISPYDLKLGASKYIYHIQNNGKSPKKIEAENQNVKICELLGFSKNYDDDFVVFIDGVKLSRPIKYLDKADSSAQFSENAYFFGKFEPDFSNFESKETGGKLKFEAFIKWSPKILPKEHRGVCIRIHGASGALFDQDFMKWQLAEYVLKSQIMVEINILEGFESALNIDRESFNIAHPHYQLVMRWLHLALRQVVSAVKSKRSEIRQEINTKAQKEKTSVYENIVSEIKTPFYDNDIPTTKVEVVKQVVEQKAGIVSLSKKDFEASTYNTQKNLDSKILPRLNAIVGVLDKFNLLENLSENQKNELIKALIKIISYKE